MSAWLTQLTETSDRNITICINMSILDAVGQC